MKVEINHDTDTENYSDTGTDTGTDADIDTIWETETENEKKEKITLDNGKLTLKIEEETKWDNSKYIFDIQKLRLKRKY